MYEIGRKEKIGKKEKTRFFYRVANNKSQQGLWYNDKIHENEFLRF